jgi:hypothetical protein
LAKIKTDGNDSFSFRLDIRCLATTLFHLATNSLPQSPQDIENLPAIASEHHIDPDVAEAISKIELIARGTDPSVYAVCN